MWYSRHRQNVTRLVSIGECSSQDVGYGDLVMQMITDFTTQMNTMSECITAFEKTRSVSSVSPATLANLSSSKYETFICSGSIYCQIGFDSQELNYVDLRPV